MAANSGIEWVNLVFDGCVKLLYDWAGVLGITYEEINVWIFVIGWPLVTLVLAGVVLWQRQQIRALR